MIVSLRQWALLRPVQFLRHKAKTAPSQPRDERSGEEGMLGQFEQMMVHHADLMLRNMNRQ